MASAPRSPVRIRITSSTGRTKILPSPIRPVLAAFSMAPTTSATFSLGDDDLELDLGQEVHDVLRAPIQLGVPLLASEALDLAHGQSLNADRAQTLLHLIQLERLDDRFDLFHLNSPRNELGEFYSNPPKL